MLVYEHMDVIKRQRRNLTCVVFSFFEVNAKRLAQGWLINVLLREAIVYVGIYILLGRLLTYFVKFKAY